MLSLCFVIVLLAVLAGQRVLRPLAQQEGSLAADARTADP